MTVPTPQHHDAGHQDVRHPNEDLRNTHPNTSQQVLDIRNAQIRPADTPEPQKYAVDADGYSADIDATLVDEMFYQKACGKPEGTVFKVRMQSPELVKYFHVQEYPDHTSGTTRYSISSPHYDPTSVFFDPDYDCYPQDGKLPKFTANIPARLTVDNTNHKRSYVDLLDDFDKDFDNLDQPPQPKRPRKALTIDTDVPNVQDQLQAPRNLIHNLESASPTPQEEQQAYEWLEQQFKLEEFNSESETEDEWLEEPDHIYPDVEEEIECHTSDDEVYPDEVDPLAQCMRDGDSNHVQLCRMRNIQRAASDATTSI